MMKKLRPYIMIVLVLLVLGGVSNHQVYGKSDLEDPLDPESPTTDHFIYLPIVNNFSGSQNDWMVVDHRAVEQFDQIPEHYVTAARNLRLLFSDRSVGENINTALDCLAAPSWATSSPGCRRDYYDSNWNWRLFEQYDLDNGLVPENITFTPDPVRYNRGNWTFDSAFR